MSDPFVGEIRMFAGNFAPQGWAFCDGQLLAISSNQALFSLLGTIYGGDGRTTFALPDLRGRVSIHPGNGPGLQSVSLGQKGGSNNHLLTVSQLPSHNHPLANNAFEGDPNQADPGGGAFAESNIYSSGTPDSRTDPSATENAGGGQQFSIMQPYLGVNYIIALVGTFPSRN